MFRSIWKPPLVFCISRRQVHVAYSRFLRKSHWLIVEPTTFQVNYSDRERKTIWLRDLILVVTLAYPVLVQFVLRIRSFGKLNQLDRKERSNPMRTHHKSKQPIGFMSHTRLLADRFVFGCSFSEWFDSIWSDSLLKNLLAQPWLGLPISLIMIRLNVG